MRKSVPCIITAVLAASVAFAVSHLVSYSNAVLSISDGEKRGWMNTTHQRDVSKVAVKQIMVPHVLNHWQKGQRALTMPWPNSR